MTSTRYLISSMALALALSLASCSEHTPSPPVTKIIAMKVAPVEQRVSFDILDDNSFRHRAKTVYYLVAQDGTAIEVDLATYVAAKEGQRWTAPADEWQRVPAE